MKVFKVGEFEAEIDPTDVAFVKKYEKAADAYNASVTRLPKEGRASDILHATCKLFFDTFDAIFGKGTSGKMFGKQESVQACVDAFGQLISIVKNYDGALSGIEAITGKNKE